MVGSTNFRHSIGKLDPFAATFLDGAVFCRQCCWEAPSRGAHHGIEDLVELLSFLVNKFMIMYDCEHVFHSRKEILEKCFTAQMNSAAAEYIINADLLMQSQGVTSLRFTY